MAAVRRGALPSHLSFRLQFTLSIAQIHPFHAITLSVEWNMRYNSHALNNLQSSRLPLPTASFTHYWTVCMGETVYAAKQWIYVITWMSTVNKTRRSMGTRLKPFTIYLPEAANECYMHLQFGPFGGLWANYSQFWCVSGFLERNKCFQTDGRHHLVSSRVNWSIALFIDIK